MATTKGPTGSVDSGPEHRRFPRSAEKHRLFLIAGTQRFQAETVDISRTGMLAACPSLPPDVGKDSEAFFEVVWSPEPEANAFIRGRVVRVIRDSDFDTILLGVEFREALARSAAALRGFLQHVLGVEHGAVRVVRDSGGHKSLVFDFRPIQREGDERLRALQSSLFQSVDDLEEADRLLEGFGTGEYLFAPDATSQGVPAAPPGARAPSRPAMSPAPAPAPAPATAPATAPSTAPARTTAAKKKTTTTKSRSTRTRTTKTATVHPAAGTASPGAPEAPPAPPPPPPPPPEPPARNTRPPATRPSLLRSLLPSFRRGEKGGELITPGPTPRSVANIEGMEIEFSVGGDRRRARAVRLYCAGLKCEVETGLPELYRSVVITIPDLGPRKTGVVLNGDVTRVRPSPEDETRGIFEVRLSLRNETEMIKAYRRLVEQLSIGEG